MRTTGPILAACLTHWSGRTPKFRTAKFGVKKFQTSLCCTRFRYLKHLDVTHKWERRTDGRTRRLVHRICRASLRCAAKNCLKQTATRVSVWTITETRCSAFVQWTDCSLLLRSAIASSNFLQFHCCGLWDRHIDDTTTSVHGQNCRAVKRESCSRHL